jgi:hypothetical protein
MFDPGHDDHGAQTSLAGVHLADDHMSLDDHRVHVVGNTPSPPANDVPTPSLIASEGITLPPTKEPATPTQRPSAATISDPGRHDHEAQISLAGADLHDAILAILAASLDDLERTRIATENRIRALRDEQGLAGSPFEAKLAALLDGLKTLEHQATLDLRRALRLHPLATFVKKTRGLGEKQAARLLAAIGDPATRENPAKLWQYAGHGDPARSRKRRGQVVEFNPTAKMRVHLCAESMLRAGNRDVYDRERAKWADRETSDGHKHNHALRVVGKALLLDLWKASRE